MRRALAAIALLLMTIGCAAATWTATRPPITPFLVPGATDVQVTEIGFGQRLITYRAPGPRYAWYFTVAQNLESHGWTPPDKWGLREQLNTYSQVSPLLFMFVWDRVDLRGDPNVARITVRRSYYIPWQRYLNSW